MPSYQLNADISAADLQTIYAAGEQIVLLKLTQGTPVAWVSFNPLENNTVQWQESYAIYGSTSEVQAGTVISMMSQAQAAPQQNYNFLPDGVFSPPTSVPTLGQDTYQITNQYIAEPMMTFGLAQGVQTNGTAFPYNPINAQSVPENQFVTFTPLTEVVIYLASQISAGMVITQVESPSTTLIFGNGVNDITVTYDAASGSFVQINSGATHSHAVYHKGKVAHKQHAHAV